MYITIARSPKRTQGELQDVKGIGTNRRFDHEITSCCVGDGGNSLIRDKNHIALSFQYEMVRETAKYIAELIAEGVRLVITHGNGPQVDSSTDEAR